MAQLIDGTWIISAQDLISEYECHHKLSLDTAVAADNLGAPKVDDPSLALLQKLGIEFEQRRLESLEATHRVKRLETPLRSLDGYQNAWETTKAAMDEGYDAIYQGTLFTGDFVGFVDFLVARKNETGEFERDGSGVIIYEPVDTKSARSAKTSAVVQVSAYAEALVRLGRPAPKEIHLWLAGDSNWSGPASNLINVAREYREQVFARLPHLGPAPTPSWAAPCSACSHCRWANNCDAGRREARDLSLIQEIRSGTRLKLVDVGISTLDQMAHASDTDRPTGISRETFTRLHEQAAIQIRGEEAGEVVFEVSDQKYVDALPPRSLGDLWFDMEGDPYANQGAGLEYMFGFGWLAGDEFTFDTTDATDNATEKLAFEKFIDFAMQRWSQFPDMHVYHYANYEVHALLRLAQKFGSKEREIDQLLSAGRLIDLYKLVRSGFLFSTERLSLKYIEEVYGLTHKDEDVSTAMDSVIQYEEVVALRAVGEHEKAQAIYKKIRSYNELDCLSTLKLDTWIREQMTTSSSVDQRIVAELESDVASDNDPESRENAYTDVIATLTQNLVLDPHERTELDRARALLAAALDYHERERRPAWWTLFDMIKAERDELELATGVLIAHKVESTEWASGPRGGKPKRTLTISNSETAPSDVFDSSGSVFLLYENAEPGIGRPADSMRGFTDATVTLTDRDEIVVVEGSGREKETWDSNPFAVIPGKPVNTAVIESTLLAEATGVVSASSPPNWVFPNLVWADLLLARAPRRKNPLPRTGDNVRDIVEALKTCDSSYVAVQGPPGTGKTYVGSHVVTALAGEGWKIGVVAQSHSVINNFLEAVHENGGVAIAKQPKKGAKETHPWDQKKIDTWAAQQPGGFVVGGTTWNFCSQAFQGLGLDLLVIDESGQFALPHAMAAAHNVKRVLLLGDPQQLPQVSQANHPEGIEESVLAHITGNTATMPPDRGYFLDLTYRMHPALTKPVSQLQYEGKLQSEPTTSMRHLDAIEPGLTPVPIDHEGNTTSSSQEAKAVITTAKDLLGRSWTGARAGKTETPRPLEQKDIIVVAAFNAQVRLIKRYLDDAGLPNIKVGTVDKFQGREEVAVIVSMATSSAEDLPRGIEFLLSPNRLNVAISRAQWVCYLIHSPVLRSAAPTSITGLERLGGFIGLLNSEPHQEKNELMAE